MTACIIDLEEWRSRITQSPPNPFIEALDALAVALTNHKHIWTDRERMLYETAISYLGVRL